jgi:hypothetical protein
VPLAVSPMVSLLVIIPSRLCVFMSAAQQEPAPARERD